MTGYYASALWVGHDNYKALSSKSTGSGAAAPLWQAYMSKIHQGLPKKEILDGNPSDYNLVKVTTCVVSGQLATEACRNDAMGYGVVTDWWAKGTEPTVSCQMHTTQTVCADTGMLASPYCPNPVQRGVVTIPSGHPLYNWLGQYQSVIEEYLGSTAVYSSVTCNVHNEYSQAQQKNYQDSQSFTEARQVLAVADSMLGGLDPGDPKYQAIQNASDYLRLLIGSDYADATEVMNAMETLTRAMGGIY
jgi:penicillin-binding protein 1A